MSATATAPAAAAPALAAAPAPTITAPAPTITAPAPKGSKGSKGSTSKGSKGSKVTSPRVTNTTDLALVVGLSGIQKLAKTLAKTLSPAAESNVKVNSGEVKKAYWNRVNEFGNAIKQVSTPELRTALVSMVNVELANDGKLAFKSQDFRHLACAYNLREAYPNVAWESYGENKLEATALKWFKGSYSDFIKSGLSCFEPSDKVVKLPNGDNGHPSKLIDNLADSMTTHASDKERVKVKLSVTQRVEKKAKSMAETFVKEYAKQKDSAFGTLVHAFFSAIRSGTDDGKINTMSILETLGNDAIACRNGTDSYA